MRVSTAPQQGRGHNQLGPESRLCRSLKTSARADDHRATCNLVTFANELCQLIGVDKTSIRKVEGVRLGSLEVFR